MIAWVVAENITQPQELAHNHRVAISLRLRKETALRMARLVTPVNNSKII